MSHFCWCVCSGKSQPFEPATIGAKGGRNAGEECQIQHGGRSLQSGVQGETISPWERPPKIYCNAVEFTVPLAELYGGVHFVEE